MSIKDKNLIDSTRLAEYTSYIKQYIDAKVLESGSGNFEDLVEMLAGKPTAYVVEAIGNITYENMGSAGALKEVTAIKTINDKTILATDLKIGDIIYVAATDTPDYWVADSTGGEAILKPLETMTVEVDGFITEDEADGKYAGIGVEGQVSDLQTFKTQSTTLHASQANTLSAHTTSINGLNSAVGTLTSTTVPEIDTRVTNLETAEVLSAADLQTMLENAGIIDTE